MSKRTRGMATNARTVIHESDHESDAGAQRMELTRIEIDLLKTNFGFYDKNRVGFVERFELPNLL